MKPITQTSNSDTSAIRDIFAKLFRDVEYQPESCIADNNVTYQALRTEFASYNNGGSFDTLCRLATTLSEVKEHSFLSLV